MNGREPGIKAHIALSSPQLERSRVAVTGKDKLTPGKHVLIVDFKYDGPGLGKGGIVTLTVDDKPVGEGKVARTRPFRMSLDETLDCGEDTGTTVSEDYRVLFKFTGTLNEVMIRIGEGKLTADEQETIRKAKVSLEMKD